MVDHTGAIADRHGKAAAPGQAAGSNMMRGDLMCGHGIDSSNGTASAVTALASRLESRRAQSRATPPVCKSTHDLLCRAWRSFRRHPPTTRTTPSCPLRRSSSLMDLSRLRRTLFRSLPPPVPQDKTACSRAIHACSANNRELPARALASPSDHARKIPRYTRPTLQNPCSEARNAENSLLIAC